MYASQKADDEIISAVLRKGSLPSVGQHIRVLCPFCAHTRRREHQRTPTLSVSCKEDRLIYMCHHCERDGFTKIPNLKNEVPKRITPMPVAENVVPMIHTEDKKPSLHEVGFNEEFAKFCASRHLKRETLEASGVKYVNHFVNGSMQFALAFPYISPKSGEPYAYKLRAVREKGFSCASNPMTLFGAEKIVAGSPVLIVEGELDVIACAEAGVTAVSIPHGAKNKLSEPGFSDPDTDRKLACLWHSRAELARASKIIVATDTDGPGQVMSEEIARRLGKAKVSRIIWDGGKDANDVLVSRGVDYLRKQVDNAQPWPLEGVRSVSDFSDDVKDLYDNGTVSGFSVGLKSIDPLFTVAPGMLTVLTGHPNSGKSEWLDFCMVKMALTHGWKFAIASFENPPKLHLAKLLEKLIEAPFFSGPTPRITKEDLEKGLAFLNRHFVFLDFNDGSPPTIEAVLERADLAVQRLGCRGLVIDPFNYLVPTGNDGWTPERISAMLSEVKRFAISHDSHAFMIAHPAKMIRTGKDLPVPTGMDISGAYAWWAKADHGITVHRLEGTNVLVKSWKSRFKWLGSQGESVLHYDVVSGTYSDTEVNSSAQNDDPWDDI